MALPSQLALAENLLRLLAAAIPSSSASDHDAQSDEISNGQMLIHQPLCKLQPRGAEDKAQSRRGMPMTSAWPAWGLVLTFPAWTQRLLDTHTLQYYPGVWHALCPQVPGLKHSNCNCN